MELSITIPTQHSNQRDENFRKWKAESFPTQTPRFYDPKKMMDKKLYKYAAEDRFDELFDHLRFLSSMELSSIIYTQVSPSGNSLLHVSASHGMKDVTELLLQNFPRLMTGKNFHGDTALHLAAGAGQLETTAILINKAKGHGEANDFRYILEMKNDRGNTALHEANDFRYILEMENDRGNTALHEANDFRYILEMKNDRGNTALHEAVIHRHHAVARFLVSECSELCYTENKDHESPLYHAVENSDKEMLSILMLAIPHHDVDLLRNLKGKSPVHAAVQGRKREFSGEQIPKGKSTKFLNESSRIMSTTSRFSYYSTVLGGFLSSRDGEQAAGAIQLLTAKPLTDLHIAEEDTIEGR
ncbi:hypothetical protein OIU78_023071 [Salix suchowensis]|nr:hypothetical protein OIU78_023071 [Salix suchowensis]